MGRVTLPELPNVLHSLRLIMLHENRSQDGL